MQKVVIVLGMHRSGTSCLAGALEKAGVYLGEVSTNNPHNLKGNRENSRIMKLHNDVLEYNNGDWDDPPSYVLWPVHLKKERDRIISEYKDALLWGFKDPRVLLILDGWLEVLTNIFFAATFRHPALVVESMRKRNQKISIDKCLFLWKFYNERLLHYQKKYNFPLLSFDLNEVEYKKKFINLLKNFNLNLCPDGFEFYDISLRHHRKIPALPIPKDVIRVYKKLQKVSI